MNHSCQCYFFVKDLTFQETVKSYLFVLQNSTCKLKCQTLCYLIRFFCHWMIQYSHSFMAIIQVNLRQSAPPTSVGAEFYCLVGAQCYCLHAVDDSYQCIWIRKKMLEFSSAVLSTLSPLMQYAKRNGLHIVIESESSNRQVCDVEKCIY